MTRVLGFGPVEKMLVQPGPPVEYQFVAGETRVPMNDLLGHTIHLKHVGPIICKGCGRETRKSFSQGFCYPCFQKLACCDSCIMSPEKCHYDAGTCREPEWGETHCMRNHVVYLANSSGLKVGITRDTQVPTRWIDQGAVAAVPLYQVTTRKTSGLVETLLKRQFNDRTNWRAMLKGQVPELDLASERSALHAQFHAEIEALDDSLGGGAITVLDDAPVDFQFPVQVYPQKVASHNLDKTPHVTGTLQGIKGQYLILDTGCLNIRKYSSYTLELSVE